MGGEGRWWVGSGWVGSGWVCKPTLVFNFCPLVKLNKKKRLCVVCIPVLNLSGPNSGLVIEEEIVEWARQAKWWTIAATVFHYFMVKSFVISFFTSISWGNKLHLLLLYFTLRFINVLLHLGTIYHASTLPFQPPLPLHINSLLNICQA